MRLPRDVSGEELAHLLERFGYIVTRQTGSHMRLTREGEHHLTVPRHRQVRVGTLSNILRDVAEHIGVTREEVIDALWK